MVETKVNDYLEKERLGRLMLKYSIPCVISMLVAALYYNIVDQIFIANASYLGSYGNAANTMVFPLTVVAIAIAVMIGDGCCTFVSISLGSGKKGNACRGVGSSIIAVVAVSLVLMLIYLVLQEPILNAFGARVNNETFRLSKEYFFWITLGIPFYMFSMAATLNVAVKYGLKDEIFGQPKYSQIPTAVVDIVMKFFQIVISTAAGLAAGCIPIAGYNIGADRKDRVLGLMKRLMTAEALVGLVYPHPSLPAAVSMRKQRILYFPAVSGQGKRILCIVCHS